MDTVLLPSTDFPARANAKVKDLEIQEFWKNEGVYQKLQERPAPKGIFSLHDGPPYANGSLHMGHALNKILKDMINKYKTFQGYKTKFIPGWDCHGLPIELKVIQSLKQSQRAELTPLRLRQIAEKFARETVAEQRQSFERYGVWGDFNEPYLTLLPKYEAAQLGIFEDMVRKGHIYRGRKPVYWSPSTRTALAESELEYPEGHTSPSIYATFRCTGEASDELKEIVNVEGLEVAVWTTTPWTIPANRAVAVNPELPYAVVCGQLEDGGEPRRMIVAEGLVESMQALLKTELTIETTVQGGLLEGLKYEHPLTGLVSPVVIGGDYITTESGTGLVHTAPGHGQDDYAVGQKYGLEVAAPLNDAGDYTEEVGVESLVGANVLKDANPKVIELLKEKGSLLLERPYQHKYPYDWRSKKPVITRATPQWFASIDGLRDKVLGAIDEVKFIPDGYQNRMRPMIVGRSDWCISRQRAWGVPIPAFYRKDNSEALLTPDVVRHVRGIVEKQGTNAWFELEVEELLPDEHKADADLYTKGTDTMDVWFDSGSSWAYVQDTLGAPVDLYLEGQDQHRGWFQSSLITSVAVRGKAPYKSVMTHGFTVDENGRKMSKSIGNVMDPRDIIEGGKDQKKQPPYGADVLRYWVASVDFHRDVSISPDIIATIGDFIRKFRNRIRFLLGNLCDFDHNKDCIAYEDLPLLDKYIIHKAEDTFQRMSEAYESYSFASAMTILNKFLTEMSASYLDLSKDRLYIGAKASAERRSCQTALRWMTLNLTKVVSPVLCHMAEDIWSFLPGAKDEHSSIFLSSWWEPFPGKTPGEDPLLGKFGDLLALRDPANQALEKARKQEMIGASLEARLRIHVPEDSPLIASGSCLSKSPQPDVDELRWLLGVSAAEIIADGGKPEVAEGDVTHEDQALSATFVVSRAPGTKCERCWIICPSVGTNKAHPTICHKCAATVTAMGVQYVQPAAEPVAEPAAEPA